MTEEAKSKRPFFVQALTPDGTWKDAYTPEDKRAGVAWIKENAKPAQTFRIVQESMPPVKAQVETVRKVVLQ